MGDIVVTEVLGDYPITTVVPGAPRERTLQVSRYLHAVDDGDVVLAFGDGADDGAAASDYMPLLMG